MKYYVYVSDAKVDMLLPQIDPAARKKVTYEHKIDLKIFSSSTKSEIETNNNRIERVEAITSFIKEYGNVGNVDSPDEYIADTIFMSWGPLDNRFIHSVTPMIYFSGETSVNIIGLGGSLKHVIGGQNPGNSYIGDSFLFSLVGILSGYGGVTPQTTEDRYINDQGQRELALEAVRFLNKSKLADQKIEFLAKNLLYQPLEKEKGVILGTPIYAALVA